MKLKTIMISVNGLLDDAEEKQITKLSVNAWLDELKDALYEADDLLDEIVYEAHRSKLEASTQTVTYQVRNFFSFRDRFSKDMEVNIENILDRLEYLVNQRDALGLNLKEGLGEKPSIQKIQTTSVADEYGFYGRDGDKGTLIELLLSENANGNAALCVIPIVGMSGIGKTTLAQHIYNDSRVQDWFDLTAWVCVSEDFNVFNITKDIFEEITSKTSEANTLNKLQVELKVRLKGKKLLLVLDDVWNDKYDDWDMLQRPLRAAARGSKIVITTRNQSVALVTRTVPTHHLKELTDEDCWFLFAERAFNNGNSGSRSNMEEIGKKIVRKCKGLPLAAKALGGLLRSRGNAKEWEKVLESSIWDLSNDNILPALRLSYHCLPSHLKRCFAYCAIFPKDYHIRKEKLICLWMAEGFLGQPKGNKDLMEVGEEYFDDLVSRSFFQKSNRIYQYFVMHDLINDMAKFVFGEFCHRLEDDKKCKITNRTRHLSYLRTSYDALERFEAVYNAKLLRAFIPVSLLRYWVHAGIEEIDSKVVHDLLPVLRRLRVLSLSHYGNIVAIPDSIGELKHLRYLSFTDTPIRRLPESITSLYNLQTLILKRCKYLVELPADIVKLINLCYLDITNTRLKDMPLRLGNLTKLWKLTDFVLGSQTGSGITELGELQHLRGKLRFWNLQNLVDARDALQANLKGKKHLEELQFRWDGDTNNSMHDRDVLEQLKPHSNIGSLLIVGYGGTRFPDWLGDSTFLNIVSLKLSGCKYCSVLPPLGQLVSLKVLMIREFDAVVVVGSEFYGNCKNAKKPFASLEILRFERMPQWQEWIPCGDDEAFPCLQKLSIKKCPNFTHTVPSYLPSLTTLEIEGCQKLQTSLPRAPIIVSIKLVDESRHLWFGKVTSGLQRLKVEKFKILPPDSVHSLASLLTEIAGPSVTFDEIIIRNCHSFKCFPLELFPKLKTLSIKGCPNMESLSESGLGGEFLYLSSLEIIDCPSLVYLPRGGLDAANLTRLQFRDCFNLKSLPESMHLLLPSLVDLRLFHCEELVSFPVGGLPLKLQVLWIHFCNKLISNCNQWDLQKLSSLSEFLIGTIMDMESFPEEKLLPSSLTSLTISSYKNLKSLNYNGLQCLISLRELTIKNCPSLTELPQLLPSLVKLVIFNCQELGSFPAGGLPSNLESLVVQRCRKLIACRLQWGLERLPSLSNLTIGKDENVESFPEEMLLPCTLTSLKIKEFKNLSSLNYRGIQHLSSLRKLKIKKCSKLQSLPPEGLPSSLTSLIISGCSTLRERCQRGEGEDWPKISHIPSIEINGVSINEIND
ncbi:putative disease resistance RPP13-like protein 1 isoform X2 [Euphorbia lathyris]